jgi:hypothetical protein
MKVSNATVRSSHTQPIRSAWELEDGGQMRTTNQMNAPMRTDPTNVES